MRAAYQFLVQEIKRRIVAVARSLKAERVVWVIAALISNQVEVPGPSCICEPHTNSLFRTENGGS